MTFRALDTMRAIRELRDASAPQKAVLYALALRADDEGACWPSYGTIARDAGLSARATKENVAALQTAGHITVTKRQVAGRLEPDSNLYVVHVLHQVVQEEHQVVRQVHDVVQDVHDRGAPAAPGVVRQVHEGSAPGALYLPNELPIGTAQGTDALVLTPEGPAPAAKKSSKAPKQEPKHSPEVIAIAKRVIETHCQLYLKVKTVPAMPDDADIKHAYMLAGKHGEVAVELARRAWDDPSFQRFARIRDITVRAEGLRGTQPAKGTRTDTRQKGDAWSGNSLLARREVGT
jgi:hypothetical protein